MLHEAVMNKKHELQRAESPFALWIDTIHTEQNKEKQTGSEASRYNVSQFVNLNFSHLIRLKFSELTPKLMVKLL